METDGFQFLIDLETQKAARLQYCVSLVCVVPDVPHEGGGPSLTNELAKAAIGQLRATDVVTTLGESGVALLLVDADLASVPQIASRAMEVFEAGALTPPRRPARHTWSGGGGCYPRTAMSGPTLLRQAIRLMNRAKEEGGNRLYLAS